MLEFFANYGGTVLIGIILAAIVVLIIVKMRQNRKKGKTSCGCGCSSCPSAGICHKNNLKQ